METEDWNPPLHDTFRRTVAAELRTYIPSLVIVGFWTRHEHVHWTWDPNSVEPIEAVRPAPRKANRKSSSASAGKEIEPRNGLELQLGGRASPAKMNVAGADEGGLKERTERYTGLDGWVCHSAGHGNIVWWKAAASDELWRSPNVFQSTRR